MEVWKDIKDYNGLYQVSDLGNVKSLKWGKEKVLKPSIDTGYYRVILYKDRIRKTYLVHRLVYETFNGKTDLFIDHVIEGNKFDNRLSNLQAITHRNNISKSIICKNKSSRYIGVNWSKRDKIWRAYINFNNKKIHLGRFDTEELAHEAYQAKLNEILCRNQS